MNAIFCHEMKNTLIGMLIGPCLGMGVGMSTSFIGVGFGAALGLGCGGLVGFILDRRMMERSTNNVCLAVMAFSVASCVYLLWSSSGPVKGDMRDIETDSAFIVQRAEGNMFGPSQWRDYMVTQKRPPVQSLAAAAAKPRH